MIAEERQVCLLVIHPTLNAVSKPDRMNCSPVVSHFTFKWQQVRRVLSTINRKQRFSDECCVLQMGVCLMGGSLISVTALLQLPGYPLLPQNFLSEVPCLSPSSFFLALRKKEERKIIRVVFCLGFGFVVGGGLFFFLNQKRAF